MFEIVVASYVTITVILLVSGMLGVASISIWSPMHNIAEMVFTVGMYMLFLGALLFGLYFLWDWAL